MRHVVIRCINSWIISGAMELSERMPIMWSKVGEKAIRVETSDVQRNNVGVGKGAKSSIRSKRSIVF